MAVGSHTVRIWSLQPRLFHLGEEAVTHGYALEMDTGHMGLVGLEFLDDDTLLCVHADGVLQVWSLSTPDQPSEPIDTSHSYFQQKVPTMGRLEVYGRERRIERASTTMRARLTWELHLDIRLDACDILFVQDRLRVLLGGTRGEIYWVEVLPNMPPIAVHIGQLSSGVTLAKLSPTGDRGATACRDRTIAIWRPLEELPIDDNTGAWRVFGETGGEVWALAFSHSGRYLAGGGIDNGVYLWDLLAKNSLRAVSYDHEGWISDLAWSQEDRVLACASWDNTVGIFRGADLAPLYCFEYHQDYVSQVAFVPNSNYLISASYDRSLAVWDWRNAGLVKELQEHTDWIQSLHWLGHGTFLSGASDRSVRIWSSATLECEVVLGEGKEDNWLSASLGSIEGLERRSAASSGGFKTIRPTEQAANLDAKLRRALAATAAEPGGLGGEVSMFFDALPDEEAERVRQASELARARRLEEERAQTNQFVATGRPEREQDEESEAGVAPRETVAGIPVPVVPETDDSPSYTVSGMGLGDRISSEISDPSELVESSIADEEEKPAPPDALLRGAKPPSNTEHSGLFALEYSEGTIERLRSPFHVSNSGLLDLQEASLAVDISGIRFNASSNVQFDSTADEVPFEPRSRTPEKPEGDVTRTMRDAIDDAEAEKSDNRNVSRAQLRELFKKHLAKSASEASEVDMSSAPTPELEEPHSETEASLPSDFKIKGASPTSSSEARDDGAPAAKSTPLFQRSEAILEAASEHELAAASSNAEGDAAKVEAEDAIAPAADEREPEVEPSEDASADAEADVADAEQEAAEHDVGEHVEPEADAESEAEVAAEVDVGADADAQDEDDAGADLDAHAESEAEEEDASANQDLAEDHEELGDASPEGDVGDVDAISDAEDAEVSEPEALEAGAEISTPGVEPSITPSSEQEAGAEASEARERSEPSALEDEVVDVGEPSEVAEDEAEEPVADVGDEAKPASSSIREKLAAKLLSAAKGQQDAREEAESGEDAGEVAEDEEPRVSPEPSSAGASAEPADEPEEEEVEAEGDAKPSFNSNLLARLKAARASGAFASAPPPEARKPEASREERTKKPEALEKTPAREDGLFEIDFDSLDFQFSEAESSVGEEERAQAPEADEDLDVAVSKEVAEEQSPARGEGGEAAPMMGGQIVDGEATMPPSTRGDVTLPPRWERITVDRSEDDDAREDAEGDDHVSESSDDDVVEKDQDDVGTAEGPPLFDVSFDDEQTTPESDAEEVQVEVPVIAVKELPTAYDPSTSVEDIHPGNLATIQESFAPELPADALSLTLPDRAALAEDGDELELADEAPTGSSPRQASEVAALDSYATDGSPSEPVMFVRPEDVKEGLHRPTVPESEVSSPEADAGSDSDKGESLREDFARAMASASTRRTAPLGSLIEEANRQHQENQEEDNAAASDAEETTEYEPRMATKLQNIIAGPGVMLGDTPSAAAEQGESLSSSFVESDPEEASSPQDLEAEFDDGLDVPSAPSLETHSGILRPAKLQRRSLVIDEDDDASEEPTEQGPRAPALPGQPEPESKPLPASIPFGPTSTLSGSEHTSPRDTSDFPLMPAAQHEPPSVANTGLAESTPAYDHSGADGPSMPPSMSAANAASFAEDTRSPKKSTRPGLNPLSRGEASESRPFPSLLDMPGAPGGDVSSTMLGMSNFVYRPNETQQEDTSMAEELGAFPEVSEVLSQPEYTDFTPTLIDVSMTEIWQMRMAERKASMKIFKRASPQSQRWRNYDRVELDLGQLFSVVYNGENSLFAASGARRHVEVWSMRVGRLFQLPGRGRVIYSLTSTPNGRLLIGGDDRAYIHAWLLPGQLGAAPDPAIPRAMLTGHVSPISSLAVNSTGKLLLSGSLDGTARLWSLEDGECLAVLDHAAEPISGVVFWSKGLATVSHDGKLRLWDRRGIQIDLIEGYGKFNAVAAHRSSVYAASEDGRLIKYQRGKAVVVDQQDSPLKGVCVNPDGLIASVSASGKVKLFFNDHDAPFVLDTGIPLTCMDFGSDVLFAGTVAGKAEVFKKF